MYTLDATSNKEYYIILKDGEEFTRVSKRNNLEDVKKFFLIEEV